MAEIKSGEQAGNGREAAPTIESIVCGAEEVNDADDPQPPAFSEDSLARQFTEKHHENMRYVAAWGQWMIWDNTHWLKDETLKALDLSRAICREAAAKANERQATLASAKTVAAVNALARADRKHAATVDQWDTDLFLLNTPEGTVDLRTGRMRPHRRDDYQRRLISYD